MEDQFFHFAQTRTKAQICATFPDFPTSFLHETVADLGRKIVHMPADLPYQYRNLSFPRGGRLPEIDLPQAEMPPGSPPPEFLKQNGNGNGDRLRKKGWHDHVHKQFRPLTEKLRKEKATLYLNKGLAEANMTLQDLPDVACTDEDERCGMCWKFLLGNCNDGMRCPFVHPDPNDIPDKVVAEVLPSVTKLAGGLEKVEQKNSGKRKWRYENMNGSPKVKFG